MLVTTPEGGLKKDSVVLLNQIRAVDKERLLRRLGSLKPVTMTLVNEAIPLSLALVEIKGTSQPNPRNPLVRARRRHHNSAAGRSSARALPAPLRGALGSILQLHPPLPVLKNVGVGVGVVSTHLPSTQT